MIRNHASTSWGDWWNSGTPVQKNCKANVKVLADIENGKGWFVDGDGEKINIWDETFTKSRSHLNRDEDWKYSVCYAQHAVCSSIGEHNEDLSDDCVNSLKGCRAAFRHVHKMMFKRSSKQQQCNNFALKSIRGLFHDSMTSWVEGSILYEAELDMNLGLCRWAQYVAVLSDETQCDPGSIITMAGILGYQACGVNMFNHLQAYNAAYLPIRVNRPHQCTHNINPLISDIDTFEKKLEFSDIMLMAEGNRNEEFWFNMMHNTGFFSRYYLRVSASASLQAHAIGRVTCPQALEHPAVKGGFWDKSRIGALGEARLKMTAENVIKRLCRTQCNRGNMKNCMVNTGALCNGLITSMMSEEPLSEEEYKATVSEGVAAQVNWTECLNVFNDMYDTCTDVNNGPTRQFRDINTKIVDRWEPNLVGPFDEETNANVEAVWCNIPHIAFDKVRGLPVDGRFFIWKSIYADRGTSRPSLEFILLHNALGTRGKEVQYSEDQLCKEDLWFSIPYELTRLHQPNYAPMPDSAALRAFESIAWDGVGRMDSFWDSCEKGCPGHRPLDNRICGGPGLSDFGFDDYDCGQHRKLRHCARNVDAQEVCLGL